MKLVVLTSLLIFGANVFAQGGTKMPTAEEIIKKLELQPLPDEGGYFRQTYKSDDGGVSPSSLGLQGGTSRVFSTAIYYMVTPKSFSALHRLPSDEVFHFYGGDPVEMIQIDPSGKIEKIVLGSDILKGQMPQVVVPKGIWQGTRLKEGGRWALMGTTVAPGFEFEDLELGEREQLIKAFPHLRNVIIRFSREPGEKVH